LLGLGWNGSVFPFTVGARKVELDGYNRQPDVFEIMEKPNFLSTHNKAAPVQPNLEHPIRYLRKKYRSAFEDAFQ
jgi:hypothetical protein